MDQKELKNELVNLYNEYTKQCIKDSPSKKGTGPDDIAPSFGGFMMWLETGLTRPEDN